MPPASNNSNNNNTTATTSWHPSGYNGTCTLGGYDYYYYGSPGDIWPSDTGPVAMTGLAGDDPTDPRVVSCCAPFPVNLAPPCTLWCEYDPRGSGVGLQTCLETNNDGLTIHASFGHGPGRVTGWLGAGIPAGMPTAAASSAVVIAAGLAVTFAIVQWRTWRYGKKNVEGWKDAWWRSRGVDGPGDAEK